MKSALPTNQENDWTPEKPEKTPLLAQLFRPVVWVARGLAWATEPEKIKSRGKVAITGKVLLFSCGMLYSFGLTTESILLLLKSQTQNIYSTRATPEEVRFMPKLGVEDGAEIGRIIPSPLKVVRLTSNFAFGWVPGYRAFGNTAFDNYLVWADPIFYVSVVGAAVTGILQAMALRKVSIQIRKARLDKVRHYRVDDLSPKALTIARIRAAEYKNAEVGGVVFQGAVILASYAFEGATFLLGFDLGDSNFAFLLINGSIQIFGFETCYRLTGIDTEDEEV